MPDQSAEGHIPPVSNKIEATNVVVWKDKSIRARIDPTLDIRDVIRQFSVSFDTNESYITLAIRDEADHLVTNDNLARKINGHEKLKLVPSPTLEAMEAVAALRHALHPEQRLTFPTPTGRDALTPLKMILFTLAKRIGEDDFTVEFLMQGGVGMLVELVEREGMLTGNSLAYALNSISAILDLERGWDGLSSAFISRVITITANTSLTSNITRPATSILKKLTAAEPLQSPEGKGDELSREGDDSLPSYGFRQIHSHIHVCELDLLPVVAQRLQGGDLELVSVSLEFINQILAGAIEAQDEHGDGVVQKLETLHVRRTLARLIPSNVSTSLAVPLSHYQHLYLRIIDRRLRSRVEPWRNPDHERMLDEIWKAAKLETHGAEGRSRMGWSALGLGLDGQESGEGDMFDGVGVQGLECLHYYARHEEDLSRMVLEQQAKSNDHRCPIGLVSAECVKALLDHYKQADSESPSSLRPYFFSFAKLHYLTMRFFLRMWHESSASKADFERLVKLTRSHISVSLAGEASKSWLELELDFLETDYRSARERQMVDLERGDNLLKAPGVKLLRSQLQREAMEFMIDQRINCMLQGGWFYSGLLVRQGITALKSAQQTKPWRFVRLLPSRRTLVWDEFTSRKANTPSTSALREKIDLASVTAVVPHTSANVTARQAAPSPNSFSIMSSAKSSLLDLVCIHTEQYAEWIDGFKMLRHEAGGSTKETANYVHILADLALKVRLLDLTGEGVSVPDQISCGPAPASTDFYFASS